MQPNLKMTKTFQRSESKKNTFLVNAKGKTLGRLSSEIAKILTGKHKPVFTPNVDLGDAVVVVNASQIVVTGTKEVNKIYGYHTGWMGGRREVPFRTMKERNPGYIIEHAVKGMLPKTTLAHEQIKKLRVFKDENHGMTAEMIEL
jgi:large subunit ribosomal protein L13